MGVSMHRSDYTSKRNASGRRVRFFEFERHLKSAPTADVVRHTLRVEWHTKAGAWQAALRWAKKLDRGELL
jgi:hypothetical protein